MINLQQNQPMEAIRIESESLEHDLIINTIKELKSKKCVTYKKDLKKSFIQCKNCITRFCSKDCWLSKEFNHGIKCPLIQDFPFVTLNFLIIRVLKNLLIKTLSFRLLSIIFLKKVKTLNIISKYNKCFTQKVCINFFTLEKKNLLSIMNQGKWKFNLILDIEIINDFPNKEVLKTAQNKEQETHIDDNLNVKILPNYKALTPVNSLVKRKD